MRLPVSKVYRAFPELDRFEDARCEAYVRSVRRSQGVLGLLISLIHVAIGVVTTIFLMIAFSLAISAMTYGPGRQSTFAVILIAVAVVAPAIGCFLGFFLRDRRLRRLMLRQIEGSRCPECGYLLLGLVPRDEAICCPECGTRYTLSELGLTQDQLMPTSKASD